MNLIPLLNADLKNISEEGLKLGSLNVKCTEYIDPKRPGVLNLFRFNYENEVRVRNLNYEYTLHKNNDAFYVETLDTLSNNKFTTHFDNTLTLITEEKEL